MIIGLRASFSIFPCSMTVKTLQYNLVFKVEHCWKIVEFVGVYLPYFPDKRIYPFINKVGVTQEFNELTLDMLDKILLAWTFLIKAAIWRYVQTFSIFRPKYHLKFIRTKNGC